MDRAPMLTELSATLNMAAAALAELASTAAQPARPGVPFLQ